MDEYKTIPNPTVVQTENILSSNCTKTVEVPTPRTITPFSIDHLLQKDSPSTSKMSSHDTYIPTPITSQPIGKLLVEGRHQASQTDDQLMWSYIYKTFLEGKNHTQSPTITWEPPIPYQNQSSTHHRSHARDHQIAPRRDHTWEYDRDNEAYYAGQRRETNYQAPHQEAHTHHYQDQQDQTHRRETRQPTDCQPSIWDRIY